MADRSFEELLPQSGGSVYHLILMAAKRASEISDGAPTLIKHAQTDKLTTIALEEIAQKKIFLKGFTKKPKQAKVEAPEDEMVTIELDDEPEEK